MRHLFVSYAREDGGFARDLVRGLERRGIESWIERDDIADGAEWRTEISRAISLRATPGVA